MLVLALPIVSMYGNVGIYIYINIYIYIYTIHGFYGLEYFALEWPDVLCGPRSLPFCQGGWWFDA